ncbi:MAG: alpha/beta fold hydrolase [Leptonema sp. (in: bacteria)]
MNFLNIKQNVYYLVGKSLFSLRNFKIHRQILRNGFFLKKSYFEGITIYFYTNFQNTPHGNKKNLVLLHGFLDSSFTFRKILTYLKDDYNLFILDIPGHGNTKVPYIRELWQISTLTRAMYRFLFEYLQIPKPIFLTHSMGGFLVFHMLSYAKKRGDFPKNFNCILFAIAPGMLQFQKDLRERNQRMFFPSTIQDIDNLLKNLFPKNLKEIPLFVKYFLLKEWNHLGLQYLIKNTLENEEEVFYTEKTLQKNPFPKETILIWGDKDTIVPMEYSKKLLKIIKPSKLIIIPETGHTPHIEEPELFYKKIRKDLERINQIRF